jgi:hypothetical protein
MTTHGYKIVDRRELSFSTANCLNPNSTGSDATFSLANLQLNCKTNHFYAINMKQFSMYNSFTNINTNNNKFTLYDGTNYDVVELDKLNFITIRDIAKNFADKINETLISRGYYATGTIVINKPTSLNNDGTLDFTITTNVNHGLTNDQIKGYFNVSQGDCFELIGARRSKVDNTTNGITMTAPTANTINITGFYPMQLTTEAYVFLHCDLVSGRAVTTRNYSAGSADITGDNMTFSDLFAIFPIQTDVIAYQSNTENEYFELLPNVKSMNSIRLYLTDSKGRSIPLMDSLQDTLGNRFFTATIELQTMEPIEDPVERLPKEMKENPTGINTSNAFQGRYNSKV